MQSGWHQREDGEEFYWDGSRWFRHPSSPLFAQVTSKEGRINRLSFIVITVVLVALFPVFSLVNVVLGGGEVGQIVVAVLLSITLVFNQTKRMHDLGMGGVTVLILVIPLVNVLAWIWLAFKPGERRINQYGLLPTRGLRFENR